MDILYTGRGYFNIDPTNNPIVQIQHTTPLANNEIDANLTVRLGGSLKLGNHPGDLFYPSKDKNNKFGNYDPWIEIWDLDRNETRIDNNKSRA